MVLVVSIQLNHAIKLLPKQGSRWCVGSIIGDGNTIGRYAKVEATTTATSCKSARTCRDAVILWCGGYSRADANGDGTPCENVCRSRAQVEPIKKEIDCER